MVKSISVSFLTTLLVAGSALAVEKYQLDPAFEAMRTVNLNGKDVKVTNHLDITGATDLHKLGYRGKETKAIVVDNYVDPTHPALTGLTASSLHGKYYALTMENPDHGMHVTGIVRETAPEAKIKFITSYDVNGFRTKKSLCEALEEAARSEGDIVNLSWGLGRQIPPEIKAALKNIVDSGKVIFLALGNEYQFKSKRPQAIDYAKNILALAADPEMQDMIVPIASTVYNTQ